MSTTSRRRRAQREAAAAAPRRRIHLPSLGILGILGIAAILALSLFLAQGLGTSGNSLPVGTNNVKGSDSAPVTIEDWSDFQCGACKTFADTIKRQLEQTLIAEGQVRLVFRHMAFLGPESTQAAAASECAAEQSQFWAYHDRLFAEQRGRDAGAFSKSNLKRFGAEVGLDTASFKACVDDDLAVARIRAEAQAADQKGVRKTPTLFVNGQKIEGVPTWEQMRRIIEQSQAIVPQLRGPGL